jgi:LacI family transcriptional regulator
VVESLGYEPNNAARNLAGSHNYSIGYIYSNPNAYYVIEFQDGLLNSCHTNGYELLIHPVAAGQSDIQGVIDRLVRRSRVAGIVLTPPFSEDSSVIKLLESRAIPFVRIISSQPPEVADPRCIYIDDYHAAYDIAEHFLTLGHRNIAVLSGDESHGSTSERIDGFLSGLNSASGDDKPLVEVYPGEYSFESGVKAMKELLANDKRPTAVFALNDEIAAGALFVARLHNIKIPEQLSIVGFENSPFSRQTWPKLTTAHQPIREIATIAGQRLMDLIKPSSRLPETLVFRPILIRRESTAQIND